MEIEELKSLYDKLLNDSLILITGLQNIKVDPL